jgi:excisionase family DNA binding protein
MKTKAKTASQTKHHDRKTYTPDDLAQILGIARNSVYAALRNGGIPNVRIGRRFVIPKAAIESWFASIGQQTLRVPGDRRQ